MAAGGLFAVLFEIDLIDRRILGTANDALDTVFTIGLVGVALRMADAAAVGGRQTEAVLTAPETRSSSPVRILRGKDRVSLGLRGLYPCGEGAGYAGGISSAAVDGMRCAEALIGNLQNL